MQGEKNRREGVRRASYMVNVNSLPVGPSKTCFAIFSVIRRGEFLTKNTDTLNNSDSNLFLRQVGPLTLVMSPGPTAPANVCVAHPKPTFGDSKKPFEMLRGTQGANI